LIIYGWFEDVPNKNSETKDKKPQNDFEVMAKTKSTQNFRVYRGNGL
jgi:hypothetical protein